MATKSEVRLRHTGRNTADHKSSQPSFQSSSGKSNEKEKRSYGSLHFIGILLLLCVLTYIVYVSVTFLPLSKPIDTILTEFSGDRARKHMEAITNIGARPSGSYANDIKAVRYILNELHRIKDNADPGFHIDVELQTVSGSFAFVRKSNYIDLGFTSAYGNITNIVVKMSSTKTSNVFVLVNAHYDTVMNTEGASDDTVSCAVLIEIFRTLTSSSPTKLKHGIIFLFNGAEEGGLSGSHGFIQHKWFPLVKAVVNAEAAGSGGREFVFQTGPDQPWIIDTYASSAKYPYASIVAQEIFQSGIIPSDTDFRVFVDYGNLVGIDIAFINNGYVYHTKYDDAKSIPSGSIQRAGDNILGLVKGMVNSEYLANPEKYKHGNSVFFDVLGIFVVHYPQRLHSLMNNIACVVVLAYIVRCLTQQNVRKGNVGLRSLSNCSVSLTSLLLATLTILFSWLLALVVPVGVAYIFMKINVIMTWYSYPKFALVLYGLPALFGMLLGHFIGNKLCKKISSAGILSFIYGHLLIYCSLLFCANQKGILSSFLIWFWVVFPFFFSLMFEQISSKNLLAYVFLIITYSPPSLLTIYYLDTLFIFFGALLGRTGTELPSELIIAGLSALSIVIMSTYLMCIYHDAANMKTFLFFIGICCLVPICYVLSGRLQPYSARNPVTPKRLWLQHTLRTFHNSDGSVEREDSGLWIQPVDATGFQPLQHIEMFKNTEKFQCDGSYCGLPYYYAMRTVIKEHWYLRGEKPEGDFKPLSSDIYQREERPDGAVRFHFDIDGPDHIVLFLTLKANITLDWSMYKSKDGHICAMDDNLGGYAHIVFYSHGYYSDTWKFWMEFQGTSTSEPLAELGIARHYLHGKNARTKFLNAAINSLPDWICDNSWTSNYDSFILQ